jgi:hypothetical protein
VVVPVINNRHDILVDQVAEPIDFSVEAGHHIWLLRMLGQRLLENHRHALP